MTASIGLAWRLLRGGGAHGRLASWLTVAAVAVTTGLLLFAVAGNLAFSERADRGAWRNPTPAAHGAVAVEAVIPEYVATGGDTARITQVELAALRPDAPAPPGMRRFPGPGQVWVSPALADLMKRLPADQLADRFGGNPTGILDDEALVHPGELVAVSGERHADLSAGDGNSRLDDPHGGAVSPTAINGFQGEPSGDAAMYRVLTGIATVLLAVPLVIFGGAAARLTVARRDQRLAALRLVGATPRQVVTMATAEAALTAAAGAVLGAALYGLAIPLFSRISLGGGTWYLADLWVGVPVLLGVLVGVPLLVGVSAVASLRRVIISPLGVARRHTPPGMRIVRVLAFVAVLIGFAMYGTANSTIFIVFLGLSFLAFALLGPWVVALLGRIVASTARGPGRLLAGRRLVDDPRSAWRTVSGVVLTGFVAGFVVWMNPSGAVGDTGPDNRLQISVTRHGEATAVHRARSRLARRDVPARVTTSGEAKTRSLIVTVDGGDRQVNRARTALSGLVPGHAPTTEADVQRNDRQLLTDLQTGSRVVLIATFCVAIASAGITAASAVLDRRQTYALLRLAGTPLSVLNRARRAETLIPLAVLGGGAILTGMFPGLLLGLGTGLNVSGAVTLLVCVLAGTGGMLGASALSAPLLRSVTTDPTPRPD